MRIVRARYVLSLALLVSKSSWSATSCKTYDGNIEGIPVEACLAVDASSHQVSGTYFYFKHRAPILLSGSLDKAKSTGTLQEFGSKHDSKKITGTWSISSYSEREIRGTWRSGAKNMKIEMFNFDFFKPMIDHKSETQNYCMEDETPVAIGWARDSVSNLPYRELEDSLNSRGRSSKPAEWINSSKELKDAQCDKKTYENTQTEESDHSFAISPVGKFLLRMTQTTENTGIGAGPHHEFVVGEYFDLRTGKAVSPNKFYFPETMKFAQNAFDNFLDQSRDQGQITDLTLKRQTIEIGWIRPGLNNSLMSVTEPIKVKLPPHLKEIYNPIYKNPKTGQFW